MKTLITQVVPLYEGVDNTDEIEIPDGISWELRFYCEQCGNELLQGEFKEHIEKAVKDGEC